MSGLRKTKRIDYALLNSTGLKVNKLDINQEGSHDTTSSELYASIIDLSSLFSDISLENTETYKAKDSKMDTQEITHQLWQMRSWTSWMRTK